MFFDANRLSTNGVIAGQAAEELDKRERVGYMMTFTRLGEGVDPDTGEVPLAVRDGYIRGVPEKPSAAANLTILQHDHTNELLPEGGYGGASFVFPVASDDTFGRSWLVEGTPGVPNEDYPAVHAPNVPVPRGVRALIVSTTEHGNHIPMSFLSSGPMVSDYRGPQPDELSNYWHDVTPQGWLDWIRKARTSSAFEIRLWDKVCPGATSSPDPSDPKFAIALQGKSAPTAGGRLFASFPAADAFLSHTGFGPLREASSKHLTMHTHDGPVHSGALDTMALFYDGNEAGRASRDGPLPFTRNDWQDPPKGPIAVPAEIVWNPDKQYRSLCRDVRGAWEIQAYVEVGKPPKCEGTKDYQPIESPVTENPVTGRTYTPTPPLLVFSQVQGTGYRGQPRPKVFAERR
jgi:hypothetical protein